MKLAFCLFEYFPYGGMQRDCVRIAKACHALGADITFLTREWHGKYPKDCTVKLFPTKARTNAKQVQQFVEQVQQYIHQSHFDGVIGFSKMPGLDVYYAADPCYVAKAKKHGPLYKMMPNYKIYAGFEQAVFSPASRTHILMISPPQQPIYQSVYQTPDDRFTQLPPGIMPDRAAPLDYEAKRAEIRQNWDIQHKKIILMVGSGFKTKGLDRAIESVASLPPHIKQDVEFWVVGDDDAAPYQAQIRKHQLQKQVHFLGGRDDIPELLMAADCLIHPAYSENTGTVLLEAAVSGLPLLCSGVCGYAHYIEESKSGIVLDEPFIQQQCDDALLSLLDDPQPWHERGIFFGQNADIYGMVEQAAQIILEKVRDHAC